MAIGLEDVYNKVQIKLLMDLLVQYEALLPENLGRDCSEWLIGKTHSEINLNSHSRKEPAAGPNNVHRRPARMGHTLLSKVKSPSMKTVHTLAAIVENFTNFDGPLPSLTSHFSIISHHTEEIHPIEPQRGISALYIYHYTNN